MKSFSGNSYCSQPVPTYGNRFSDNPYVATYKTVDSVICIVLYLYKRISCPGPPTRIAIAFIVFLIFAALSGLRRVGVGVVI